MKFLVEKANEVMSNAYAPYSKFYVGCALLTNDDQIFTGVNVENISFGGTICAERNAINNAITNGYKKGDFKAIAVIANTSSYVRPCSICRQTFVEFFEEDMPVLMSNNNLEYETRTVSELVPFSFKDFK